jgi:hypothetical protein
MSIKSFLVDNYNNCVGEKKVKNNYTLLTFWHQSFTFKF